MKSDEVANIESVRSVINGEEKACKLKGDIYVCDFESEVDKVKIYGNGEINNLNYVVEIKDEEDSSYIVLLLDNVGDSKYLNFYINGHKNISLKKGIDLKRNCLNGLCLVEDFDFDHVLYGGSANDFIYSEENHYFDYYFDNLDCYIDNSDNSNFATNKELTYGGSTISVKYTRTSDTDNDQVIVLPVTYSEEWICENDDYKLVRANGGYLGVVVKNGITNIDLNITFKPGGIKIGLIGSLLGFGIYGVYIALTIYRKKKEKKDENV